MTGSRRGPEPRISRDAVLAAARDLPRERLSMRALGKELGVTHGALYRYFPDLNAVLVALAADVAESMAPPSEDLPWDEWLRQTARSIRRVVREHPEIGTPATWPVAVPVMQRLITEALKVLTRTFGAADALLALSVVSRFADGFARSELAGNRGTAPLSAELEAALRETGLLDEPDAAIDAEAAFERELGIVLAGIDVTLQKTSGRKPRPTSR